MSDNNAPPAPAVSIDDIRTAFLLGWSIVELRNRIMLATLTASMDSTTLQILQPPTPPPAQPIDPVTSYPKLHLSATLAYALIHTTMKDKLTADVIKAIQPLIPAGDLPILSSKQGDDAWMTSIWRTLFNRIVTLHSKRFKDSDAKGTIFDVDLITKDDTQQKKDAYSYAYLFPSIIIHPDDDKRKDYPNIGIVPSDDLGQKFKMYELTRRALNCLIILYTHPLESLAPEDMQEFKWWVVENLLRPNKDTVYTETLPEQSNSDSRVGLKILSGLVIRFLDAWNDYLRENYYVDVGPHAQEDTDKSNREIELTAYEAGCAVSGLSWSVSTVIAPLSSALNTVSADKLKNIEPTLTQQVRYTFKNVLKETDIAHIQRQILGISSALDDTYYSSHPDAKRPSVSDDTLAPANPDLPSESIRAINSSLDYWQRVAVLFSTPASQTDGKAKNVQPVPVVQPISARVGRAFQAVGEIFSPTAQPQIAPPPAENTPPVPINWMSMLTWDSSSSLRQALIRQSYIWESLILCEQSLSSFSVEKVTQRLITRFMAKVEDVIFNSQVGRQFPAIAAIVTLGIVAVSVLVVIILVLVSRNLQNFGTILLFILGSIFGFIGNIANNIGSALFPRTSNTSAMPATGTAATGTAANNNAALEQLGTITGLAGATLVSAFESAYKRILIDFGALNHAVSVADPLLEFFIVNEVKDADGKTVEGVVRDGYDFLTNVIWTGKDFEEEVDNVVSAAFGPIGAFINGSATSNSSSNKKK